jgi:hypothetical protein
MTSLSGRRSIREDNPPADCAVFALTACQWSQPSAILQVGWRIEPPVLIEVLMPTTRVDATCKNDHNVVGALDFDFDEMDVTEEMTVPSGRCPICGAELVLEPGHYEKAVDGVLRWVGPIAIN